MKKHQRVAKQLLEVMDMPSDLLYHCTQCPELNTSRKLFHSGDTLVLCICPNSANCAH